MKEVGKTYFELVRRLPLVPISDDAHLERANKLLLQLALKANREELSSDERAYQMVLSGLVSTYESIRFDFGPKLSPVDLIKYLMEENDLSQADMAPLFGGQSCVSLFLSGKRKLSKGQIEKLSERFRLSPTAFFKQAAAKTVARGKTMGSKRSPSRKRRTSA